MRSGSRIRGWTGSSPYPPAKNPFAKVPTAAPTARGFNWNKVAIHKIGTPETTKKHWENIQRLKTNGGPRSPLLASNPPTARGFTTSKKTTAKRKPTKKQLAALAKGRKILAQKRRKNK